jgi:hypothetical protein
VLADVARSRNADEIVIGSPGHKGGQLTSVAHQLLQNADRPIVIVPEAAHKWEISEHLHFEPPAHVQAGSMRHVNGF